MKRTIPKRKWSFWFSVDRTSGKFPYEAAYLHMLWYPTKKCQKLTVSFTIFLSGPWKPQLLRWKFLQLELPPRSGYPKVGFLTFFPFLICWLVALKPLIHLCVLLSWISFRKGDKHVVKVVSNLFSKSPSFLKPFSLFLFSYTVLQTEFSLIDICR